MSLRFRDSGSVLGPIARAVVVAVLVVFVPARAATLRVDTDGHASLTDCAAGDPAFGSIQAAIDASSPGDTIDVCAGTYNEQLVIGASRGPLTLRGAGAGTTVVRPLTVVPNSTSVLLGVAASAIVLVDGAADVTIRALGIDGSAADAGAILFADCRVTPFYIGVFVRGASATLDAVRVTGVRSATACADAIRAENARASLRSSLVERYGRTGITCAGQPTDCEIVGNTLRGLGPVSDQTQVGISIRSAAGARIEDNVITDHFLVGVHGVPSASVGIVLFNPQPSTEPHLRTRNVFDANQFDIQRQSSAAAF